MSELQALGAVRRGRNSACLPSLPPRLPKRLDGARRRQVPTAHDQSDDDTGGLGDETGSIDANKLDSSLPCPSLIIIGEETPDDGRQSLSPNGEGGTSEQSTSPRPLPPEHVPPKKRPARVKVAQKDLFTLLNYMSASEVDHEIVWTCMRCRHQANERKDDGSPNTSDLLSHVRRCYEIENDELLGSEKSQMEKPKREVASESGEVRVFRIIVDGSPNSVHRPPASRVGDSHPDRDLAAMERARLMQYFQESGTTDAASWTCKTCGRSINKYTSHGDPNSASVRLHVLQCYGRDAFQGLLEKTTPSSQVHSESERLGEFRAGASVTPAPTGVASTPTRRTLEQERRLVQHFLVRPAGTCGMWSCKRCGAALKQTTNNDKGMESTANQFSTLIRHVRGCVGEDEIRQFLSTESIDKFRRGSLEADTPCNKSVAERKRIVRDDSSPCWDVDVVLNAPEKPHAGYDTLTNAVASTAVRHGDSRWDYFLCKHVSAILNIELDPEARYFVREVDGSFRLASHLEVREKVLDLFSQIFPPSEEFLAERMGPHEPEGEAAQDVLPDDDVSVVSALHQD